jgi:hypothetical protein
MLVHKTLSKIANHSTTTYRSTLLAIGCQLVDKIDLPGLWLPSSCLYPISHFRLKKYNGVVVLSLSTSACEL